MAVAQLWIVRRIRIMLTQDENDFGKMLRAYAAFQTATALLVATKSGEICGAWIVVCLFAFSIPATLAYTTLHRQSPNYEERNPKIVSFICFILAFGFSIAALSVLLAEASIIAAIIFPVGCISWFLTTLHLWAETKKDGDGVVNTIHE